MGSSSARAHLSSTCRVAHGTMTCLHRCLGRCGSFAPKFNSKSPENSCQRPCSRHRHWHGAETLPAVGKLCFLYLPVPGRKTEDVELLGLFAATKVLKTTSPYDICKALNLFEVSCRKALRRGCETNVCNLLARDSIEFCLYSSLLLFGKTKEMEMGAPGISGYPKLRSLRCH